jgi:DNA gyrase subunit A
MDLTKNIIDVSIEKEMQDSYLAYAMSVIISRAIPDARDGLKPVHRRIIHTMNEIGCHHNRAHKKSARIVGEVMGKYHPHGDSAIYDALVRLAQDFSMGTKLLDGQGNFGSIDADPPAAMRYTETRFAKITHTMLADLDKNTVEFRDNYDGTEREPSVLPASFPNLLVNGGEGIAVGMATSIATHNLGEVLDACLAFIRNPEISIQELIKIVPGPDFPTGGIILSKVAANNTMMTGRGSIQVRGRVHFEELKAGREAIIITQIPYQVVKATMIQKIAELVKEKKIEGISAIRDESNKNGIRVVIEVKKDASSEIVLNHLYKLTPLQSSFAVNMLALNKNKPELMNLKSIIKTFTEFRSEVVTKRTIYLLNDVRQRAHIVIGFFVAVDSIDRIIAIIRSSSDAQEAKERLMLETWPATDTVIRMIELVHDKENFVQEGRFKFTQAQTKAILDMRLARLTAIEKGNLINEIDQLSRDIIEYLSILRDKEKLMSIIANEIELIRNEYSVERRTEIMEYEIGETSIEDFIEKKDILVSSTLNGYIKRTDLEIYASQRRGGKGKIGMATLEDDVVSNVFIANTLSPILFFTTKGKVYRLKAYQIPESAANTRGRAFINLLKVEKDEKIAALMPLPVDKSEWRNYDMIFATKKGKVRRSCIEDFENINSSGKIAIDLDEDDNLISVNLAKQNDNVMLATKSGLAIRFAIDELRVIKSRSSDGVRGITLEDNDEVVSLCILTENENNSEIKNQYLRIDVDLRLKIRNKQISDLELTMELAKLDQDLFKLNVEQVKDLAKYEQMLLTVTENGFGKRTSAYEYRITGRGGKGIININTEKNGSVVSTVIAEDDDDVILVGTRGKTIRTTAATISVIGRNTRGVKIIALDEAEIIASLSVY